MGTSKDARTEGLNSGKGRAQVHCFVVLVVGRDCLRRLIFDCVVLVYDLLTIFPRYHLPIFKETEPHIFNEEIVRNSTRLIV